MFKFEDVVDFLTNNANIPFDLWEDMRLKEENLNTIQSYNILSIMYRLGRTEERYGSAIKIYDTILGFVNTINPPSQPMQSPYSYYQLPSIEAKYRNELIFLTERIPCYVLINIAKDKGVDWILDKFGDEVKRLYYAGQNQCRKN